MSATQCFYPNGDSSKENDIPCGSGNGVGCCPSGWACQVNGLCYLANQQYFGRYTCTDKSWKSPGCPQICTRNNTANGNEAVLQCSPGSFCCDSSRPELSGGQGCCNASTERFSIDGNVAMTAMSEAPASATAPLSTVLTSSAPSSSQTTDSLSPTSVVVVVTSVLNQDSEKTVTSIPSNSDSNSQSTHTGAIVGGAVGGALAIIAIAMIGFLLLRRRQQRCNPPHVFRKFSLKDGLDPMYKDRRSLKSLFKSETPSELIGSVPDLRAEIGEKELERRYESPSDVGKLLTPQHNSRDLQQVSPLSQNFPDVHSEPAELPTPGNTKPDAAVYEMPERSNTRKLAR